MRDAKRALPILIGAVVIVVGVVIGPAVHRDVSPPFAYYPETGYVVREPFLTPFQEWGGSDLLGYPVSDAYRTGDDVLVQTFQHVQLQLTVRGVELAPIGLRLHLGQPDTTIPVAAPFAEFYQAHGGVEFFGAALGEARTEHGLLVQDFETVRLIREAGGEVRLADLGALYLAAFPGPDSSGRAALRLNSTPTPPTAVRLNLSVEKPTIGLDGEQTVYLYVEDGAGRPIAGAQALAILHFDAATAELVLNPTDARGLTQATFVTPPATAGSRVVVEMYVLVGETLLTIETAYFQWW